MGRDPRCACAIEHRHFRVTSARRGEIRPQSWGYTAAMRRMGSSIAILVSLLTLVVVACTPAVPTAAPTPEPTSTTTPSPTATPTPIPPPVASFSMDVSSGTAPVNVQFSDTSQGPVTTWEWDFGDGSSSTA